MKRLLALVSILVAGAAVALAQGSVSTTSRVEFCKVKNALGAYSFSKGARIGVTITPIKAEIARGKEGRATSGPMVPGGGRDMLGVAANSVVYQNDSGTFFVAADGPSCLDDLQLTAAANNKAWKIVSFGVHLDSTDRSGKFLVRWRGFQTYTTQLGPGVMAFDDEMFDFGFYLQRSQFPSSDTTFVVTVDLTLNPLAIVPDQTCYLAQQFRQPQLPVEHGEGLFDGSTWNVFSSAGPQVGFSEDLFWYDSPPDGVYDETEVDAFDPNEGGAGAGNFYFKIEVGSGTTTSLSPFTYTWIRGVYQSGNIGSLWFDDSNYNIAKAGLVLFPNEPPAQIQVETFSPTLSPTSMRIDVDAKVNTAGLSMKVELWNYTTGQWVNVVSGPVATADTTMIGFGATPPQFVDQSSGTMRAKVSFYRTGLTLVWPWTASVDRITWTITNS